MPEARHALRPRIGGRLAAFVLLLLPGVAAAQATAQATPPDSLSLEQALRLAHEHNPSFLQQRNDLRVANASVRSAYGDLLPSADISNGYGYTAAGERRFNSVEFGQQPAIYSSNYQLGIGYRLSGATLLAPRLERARRTATRRQVAGAEADLDALVSQQYLTALQAREQVVQAGKEVARAQEHLRLAQAKLDVGSGTPLDVRSAEVTLGQAQVAVVKAQNDAATATITLGQYIGMPIDPQTPLSSHFTVFEPKWNADELVRTALERNPTLLASRATASAARTGVKSARTSYLPSLSFNVGWFGSVYQAGNIAPLVAGSLEQSRQQFQGCQQSNQIGALIGQPPRDCSPFDVSNPAVEQSIRDEIRSQNSGFPFNYTRQPMSASVTISLPIFQGFSRQLQVETAKAQAEDAQNEVRAQELSLRQGVSSQLLTLEAAYRTALLQEQVRQNAEEQLRLAQERFRFGAANSIEVTDAEANLAQAERDQINAVYDFHKTLAALEALLGQSLR
jgi:outer membrane protein